VLLWMCRCPFLRGMETGICSSPESEFLELGETGEIGREVDVDLSKNVTRI